MEYFPGFTTLQLCNKVQEFLSNMSTEPEDFTDVLASEMVEQLGGSPKVFPKDRIQQRFADQTIDTPDISLNEKIVEGPVTQTRQHTRSGETHHPGKDQPGDQAHRDPTVADR